MNVGEGETRCYWLEPTGLGRVILRRFTFTDQWPCGAHPQTGCDASHTMRATHEFPWQEDADGYTVLRAPGAVAPPRTSGSWPRRCAGCGHKFPRSAKWQTAWAEGYRRRDTGEDVWVRNVYGREYAGALFDGRWLHGRGADFHKVRDRGDGIALVCICPNGAPWVVDGEGTGGGYWERTGDPREPETLSATPSIRASDYHGYLTNGVLTAHMG